jgi:hypothetical protein
MCCGSIAEAEYLIQENSHVSVDNLFVSLQIGVGWSV